MNLYITAMEAYEDDKGEMPMFSIEAFDEVSFDVQLKSTVHTLESWRDLSAKIDSALTLAGTPYR